MFGRVAIIGSISGYNATSPRTGRTSIELVSSKCFFLFPTDESKIRNLFKTKLHCCSNQLKSNSFVKSAVLQWMGKLIFPFSKISHCIIYTLLIKQTTNTIKLELHLNSFKRKPQCIWICDWFTYSGPELYFTILMKRLSLRGFEVPDAPREKWIQALTDIGKWIKEVIFILYILKCID